MCSSHLSVPESQADFRTQLTLFTAELWEFGGSQLCSPPRQPSLALRRTLRHILLAWPQNCPPEAFTLRLCACNKATRNQPQLFSQTCWVLFLFLPSHCGTVRARFPTKGERRVWEHMQVIYLAWALSGTFHCHSHCELIYVWKTLFLCSRPPTLALVASVPSPAMISETKKEESVRQLFHPRSRVLQSLFLSSLASCGSLCRSQFTAKIKLLQWGLRDTVTYDRSPRCISNNCGDILNPDQQFLYI